ncbi:MAG: hypothetical protein HY262_12600 [Chloroflexi bacterium]|nr:hypothetical protein [Chloroflexota bacterium]
MPRISQAVTGRKLVMVGLVRHRGLDPRNLQRSHQVLAYGIETQDGTTTIRIYDPNWPDRDDVTLSVGPAAISQSTGEVLFGVLSLG